MERIREIAARLVSLYGTGDPFEICENLDIAVLTVELPFQIRGFYSRILQTPIIYLNTALRDERERRAVCAHELGHAVLHAAHNSLFLKQNTDFVTAKYEKEADLFAGYLLLDDTTIEIGRAHV